MLLSHEVLIDWLETIGYVGVAAIIFCETGLFFGFFLPGDSLLFITGLLARREIFNLWIIIPLLIVMSFLGYVFGYWFGDRLEHWLLARPDSMWFRQSYIKKTRQFYGKHGSKAILIGRLVPIVRTFCAIVAGMVSMSYFRFLFFNLLGSVIWICFFVLLGYYLAEIFPGIIDYMMIVVVCIVGLMLVVPFVQSRFHKS